MIHCRSLAVPKMLRLPRFLLCRLLRAIRSFRLQVATQPHDLVSCGTKNKQSSSNIQAVPSLETESRSSVKTHSATVHSFLLWSQLKLKGQSKSLWQLKDSSTVKIKKQQICQQTPSTSLHWHFSSFSFSLFLLLSSSR